jgi:hypothetical protein
VPIFLIGVVLADALAIVAYELIVSIEDAILRGTPPVAEFADIVADVAADTARQSRKAVIVCARGNSII